jgi:hypothetical protein
MVSNIREKLAGLRAAPGKLSIGHAYRRGLERFVNEWPRTHMGLVAALSSLGLVYLLGFPLAAAWLLLRLPGRAMQAGGAADWLVLGGVVVLIGVLGLVSWQILRLRFELPGGEVIGHAEAPALFDTVDELCGLHGGPPVHRIVLTGGFEVEVIRTPRFGLPFAFSNTLVMGLPVLLSLDVPQARVLMARRIGQLAARHCRLSSWLHMSGHLWPQYRTGAGAAPPPLSWVLLAFFPWYLPVLRRLSRHAALQSEFDADTHAMSIINDLEVAQALVASAVRERYLAEVFWPGMLPEFPDSPRPRSLPYGQMTEAIRGLGVAGIRPWIERAWSGEAPDTGRIPGLRRRLEHLGYDKPPVPGPLAQSAASHYFGTSLGTWIKRMDGLWLQGNMPMWSERYGTRQRSLQRLNALAAKVQAGRLDAREARNLAVLAERLFPAAQAVAVYRQLLALDVPDAGLNLRIGRFLLAQGEEAGVVALERAAAQDRTCARAVARLLARFFSERGQPEIATRYLKEALATLGT